MLLLSYCQFTINFLRWFPLFDKVWLVTFGESPLVRNVLLFPRDLCFHKNQPQQLSTLLWCFLLIREEYKQRYTMHRQFTNDALQQRQSISEIAMQSRADSPLLSHVKPKKIPNSLYFNQTGICTWITLALIKMQIFWEWRRSWICTTWHSAFLTSSCWCRSAKGQSGWPRNYTFTTGPWRDWAPPSPSIVSKGLKTNIGIMCKSGLKPGEIGHCETSLRESISSLQFLEAHRHSQNVQ